MAVLKKALVLLAIGTIVGWFLGFAPAGQRDEPDPAERQWME